MILFFYCQEMLFRILQYLFPTSLLKCIKIYTIYQILCCLTAKMAITRVLMKFMARLLRKTDLQPKMQTRQVPVVSHWRMSRMSRMLQCEERELWRLIYNETKLSQDQRSSLPEALADCVFTCGSSIEDFKVGGIVNVYTGPLNCYDLVEKRHYSTGYTPICIYCGDDCASAVMSL